LKKKV